MIFYRRRIRSLARAPQYVVYGVASVVDVTSPDPVAAIGGFPPGWRPTRRPGECVWDEVRRPRCFLTMVPREAFGEFEQGSKADALTAYPHIAALCPPCPTVAGSAIIS